MNVKLSYLYRDAGNYKNFGEVVFWNDSNLSIPFLEESLFPNLIDGSWFVADKWQLPDLHFKEFDWNSELDHDWHEYEMMELTDDPPTMEIDVMEWMEAINRKR